VLPGDLVPPPGAAHAAAGDLAPPLGDLVPPLGEAHAAGVGGAPSVRHGVGRGGCGSGERRGRGWPASQKRQGRLGTPTSGEG
jgi:hypothetical protein